MKKIAKKIIYSIRFNMKIYTKVIFLDKSQMPNYEEKKSKKEKNGAYYPFSLKSTFTTMYKMVKNWK